MKKIMFNDRFGLTQAVLDGRKTMTRRVISPRDSKKTKAIVSPLKCNFYIDALYSRYQVGEVVAIAQSYNDVIEEWKKGYGQGFFLSLKDRAGMTNKMFVRSEEMPHHIKITDILVEHLQDISDKDCLREGIYFDKEGGQSIGYPLAVPFYYTFRGAINRDGKQLYWSTPKDAFAALIDKVSGKGTWDSNPLVWVYEFELVD